MLDLDLGAPGLARWPDFKPDYADFGVTFNQYLANSIPARRQLPPAGEKWDAAKDSRPLPLYRIKGVHYESQKHPGQAWRNLEPGALWTLPPGPLDEEHFANLTERIGYPNYDSAFQTEITDVFNRIRNELSPNYLLVDLSPGLGFPFEHLMQSIPGGALDLVVFTSRLTVQAFEGFALMGSLARSRSQLLPVVTFVPENYRVTRQFSSRLANIEEILGGIPIRYVIPLLPALGVAETILTAAPPSEIPDGLIFWQLADEIAVRLGDALSEFKAGESHERRFRAQSASQAQAGESHLIDCVRRSYTAAYSINPGLPLSSLGVCRYLSICNHVRLARQWLAIYFELQRPERHDCQEAHRWFIRQIENGRPVDLYVLAILLVFETDSSSVNDRSDLLWGMHALDPEETSRLAAFIEEKTAPESLFRSFFVERSRQPFLNPSAGLPRILKQIGLRPWAEYSRLVVNRSGIDSNDVVDTLATIANAAAISTGPDSGDRTESPLDLAVLNLDVLRDKIDERRCQLKDLLASEFGADQGDRFRLYSIFGAYRELSVEEAVRQSDIIWIRTRLPLEVAENFIELSALTVLDGGWPRYLPRRENATLPEESCLEKLLRSADHRQLHPFNNRYLYISTLEPAHSIMADCLAQAPGSRWVVVNQHNPPPDGDPNAWLEIAPPIRAQDWLDHSVNYPEQPHAQVLSSNARGNSDSFPAGLSILVEDQAPGRALRDILSETQKPAAALGLQSVTVTLTSFAEIHRQLTFVSTNDSTEHLGSLGPDLLVLSQPRFAYLVSRRDLIARERALPGEFRSRGTGYLFSFNTGYLVYRRSLFDSSSIRNAYYSEWQTGISRKSKLQPPRTLAELLEKAAFFEYLVRERPGLAPGLKSGLGLPYGLPKRNDEPWDAYESRIGFDTWNPFWSFWSMVSRLLLAERLRPDSACSDRFRKQLDDPDSEIFRIALRRFQVLHRFAAPDSWILTWDTLRRQLADDQTAMTLCWNDSTYLFDQFAERVRGSNEKEFGYTLLNLDCDAATSRPAAHVDAMIGVLLNPSKQAAANDLFDWFETSDIQSEFARRGGAPLSLTQSPAASRFSVGVHQGYASMDRAALRYGVPRAFNNDLDPKQIEHQAAIVAEGLYGTALLDHCPQSKADFLELYAECLANLPEGSDEK
jgi:hypothetical protein